MHRRVNLRARKNVGTTLTVLGLLEPKLVGRTRCRESDPEEPKKRAKMAKIRDLESLLRSKEGIKTSRKEQDLAEHGNRIQEEDTSQITETTDLRLPTANSFLEAGATVLSLGLPSNLQSTSDTASEFKTEESRVINRSWLLTKHDLKIDTRIGELQSVDLDLNNPFYPFKKLGQTRSTGASECGSTTAPMEKSESMRKWNEMKQKGFISSFHGVAAIPKPRGRQSKRVKDDEINKKTELTKRELVNKNTKVAAPCGLLSGLNPGIIKHVRNSKQVNSIIEAMLKSEKVEKQELNKPIDQFRSVTKSIMHEAKEHIHAPVDDRLNLTLNKEQVNESDMAMHKLNCDGCNSTTDNSKDDDALTLKLSSGVTLVSEDANSAANVECPISKENISSLSLTAASVASQWLELIQLDLKGRLAAKKRVKNAIQIELPYLLSRDLAPDQENVSLLANSNFDVHMERWLRQVEELQSQCEKGINYVGTKGFPLLESEEDNSLWKNREAWENICAVRAAAASIYSTSNLIMNKDDLPCF
ncbi:hypothetical protein HPP92_024977 [Vanilla planifolia]|uniref:Uncharacterized protein n=1 Tax=Vanilla planifolia TaxID=51239 RepID=A0A835PJ20_VANPL|nr:hypothetical protein HPP92_024977 [Vanilla planifolia]